MLAYLKDNPAVIHYGQLQAAGLVAEVGVGVHAAGHTQPGRIPIRSYRPL